MSVVPQQGPQQDELIAKLPRYQLHVSLERMEPFVRPFDSDPNGTGAFIRAEDLAAALSASRIDPPVPSPGGDTDVAEIRRMLVAVSKIHIGRKKLAITKTLTCRVCRQKFTYEVKPSYRPKCCSQKCGLVLSAQKRRKRPVER